MSSSLWMLTWIAACSYLAFVYGSEEEKRLLRFLLNNTDPDVRPLIRPTDIINITLGVEIHHVIQLDQLGENLTVSAMYTLKWVAPALRWLPEEYGNVTTLHIPPDRIWTPDLVLVNSLRRMKRRLSSTGLLSKAPVVVTPDGKSVWKSLSINKAYCHVDVIFFPFDRHLCSMNYTLWAHTVEQATLTPEPHKPLSDDAADHGIWSVELRPALTEVFEDPIGGVHDQLVVVLYLERKPLFYVYNVIYPGTAIMLVMLLSLFIPCKSGEKITFSVSVMVSISVFQQMLLKISFPSGIAVPILGQFFGTGAILATIILICSGITVKIFHEGTNSAADTPNKTLLKYLSRLACMQGQMTELLEAEETSTSHATEDTVPELSKRQRSYSLQKRRTQQPPVVAGVKTDDEQENDRSTPKIKSKHFTPLEELLSEVTDLKNLYIDHRRDERADERRARIWEKVANIFQRIAFVVTALALLGAFCGIFLQLAFRLPPTDL